MTKAIVKIGDAEAVFDGSEFTSADVSVAAILNSALRSYRLGAKPWPIAYYPNEVVGVARDAAIYCGGDLVGFETDEVFVEGRIY